MAAIFLSTLLWQADFFFEGSVYNKFTLSMIEDGDFNIINQLDRSQNNIIATESGNYPALQYPAISSYLFPFTVYTKYFITNLKAPMVHRPIDYFYAMAHILSNVFYILFGLIFLFRIAKTLKLKMFNESLIAIFFGTSFLWFFFYSSTNTNIFSLAYSIIAFYFFLYLKNTDYKTSNYFLMALICGFGFAIRVELFWIGFLYLYLLINSDAYFFKKLTAGGLGLISGLFLFFLNNYIQNKSIFPPILNYVSRTNGNHPFAFFSLNLENYLWGPNGFISVSPIYIFIALGSLLCLRYKNPLRNIYFYILIPPTLIFFRQCFVWFFPIGFQGRHQLAFFIIFILVLHELFIKMANKNIVRFIVSLCVAWNFYATFCIRAAETQSPTSWVSWVYKYRFDKNYFLKTLVSDFHALSIPLLKENIIFVLFFLPLIYFLGIILKKTYYANDIALKNIATSFILFGFFTYLLFTILNFYNNPKNVARYKSQGLYTNKVIARGTELSFFYDITEVARESIYFHVLNNRCDLALEIRSILAQYQDQVKSNIVLDPIHFKETVLKNNHYFSPLEDLAFAQKVNRVTYEKCHF